MCNHPRLIETARAELCPDCGYEFYYGDAHARGEASQSKLVNRGADQGDYGVYDRSQEDAD